MQKLWSRWQVKQPILILLFTAFLVLGMQYTAHADGTSVFQWLAQYPQYFIATVLFIGGGYYLFSNALGFFAATLLVSLLAWLWGALNYLKYTMREEYVTGDDVISFFCGELTFTTDDVTLSRHLFYFGGLFAVLAVTAFVCRYFWVKKANYHAGIKKRLLHMLCGVLLTTLIGFGIYFTENIYDYIGDAERAEKKYGLMLSFIPSNTLPHLLTSADYTLMLSSDYVREGCEKQEDKDGTSDREKETDVSQVKPNIIIIMSESLYDTAHFDNVEANPDPMRVIHQYQSQYGGGSMAVDIFGGGTANTEYEFLTGMGHKYYGYNLMYNNYINPGQMSMVSYMKQLGYHTVAIHPYKGTFFNRKQVYTDFGFDEMYFKENMKYTDDLFDVNISDYCLTQEIIDKYEKTKESGKGPYFNFSVSVGTHKPCLEYKKGKPYVYEKKVQVLPKNGNFDSTTSRDVIRYYSAVYDANEAFSELVSYFEKVEEPTVILLFGDHAPPLTDTAYDQITTESLSDEELYQTPVVTWNNYGLPKFTVDNQNANYLSSMFLSYLDFPLPKMCVYNQNLMKYWYQTNTKRCVINAKKETISQFDAQEMEVEKATLRLYQDALDMKSSLKDLWDVPEQ